MIGYSFKVDCLECGGKLTPVQNPAPTVGTFAVAVAECLKCGAEWELQVLLRPSGHKPVEGHGTDASYQAGCSCAACKRAARERRQSYRPPPSTLRHGTPEMAAKCACVFCARVRASIALQADRTKVDA